MIADHFVCLSMVISGRHRYESPTLSVPDCWAWAIEHEGDECELPWTVRESLRIAREQERRT